jgi:exodeoxyribonuclease VII large subunit
VGLRLASGASSLSDDGRAAPGTGQQAARDEDRALLPVGEYANRLRRDFQRLERVEVTGELADVRRTRVQTYFQLRDERGGVPCAIWNNELEALDLPPGCLRDGAAVVARGGPDYYPGGKNASPGFSFRVTELRPAGEGDLLARLAELRKQFEAEGLLELQKRLRRPVLPKRIGVITAEGGAARDDLVAGLGRRGWFGEVVWAFAPVQDRKAAPAITRSVGDLAALADVEAIVVSRGGGSLTDLWAFCDEDLCRTVAMLAVPVYSAVGHERDVTLLDDVAAVRCSTPTHAAEAVVGLDCGRARADLARVATRASRVPAAAISGRALPLTARAAAPARAVRAQRSMLDQKAREVRASSGRGLELRRDRIGTLLTKSLSPAVGRVARSNQAAADALLARTAAAGTAARASVERGRALCRATEVTLRAHDPQRTLERGFARVEDEAGEPILTTAQARVAGRFGVVFAGGRFDAEVAAARRRRRRTRPRDPAEFGQTRLKGLDPDE